MKYYLSIILLVTISSFAFGQTHQSANVAAPSTKQTIEQVLKTKEPIFTTEIAKSTNQSEYFPGDYASFKMVHTYQGLAIHPDIIGIREGESIGYMFLCRIPEPKRFDIYVNDKNPDFGFYSIGPDKGIYPCEIRNFGDGISIVYHHAGRFLVQWKEGLIFDGTNTYKL